MQELVPRSFAMRKWRTIARAKWLQVHNLTGFLGSHELLRQVILMLEDGEAKAEILEAEA